MDVNTAEENKLLNTPGEGLGRPYTKGGFPNTLSGGRVMVWALLSKERTTIAVQKEERNGQKEHWGHPGMGPGTQTPKDLYWGRTFHFDPPEIHRLANPNKAVRGTKVGEDGPFFQVGCLKGGGSSLEAGMAGLFAATAL